MVIPVRKGRGQKSQEFKVILNYTTSSRSSSDIENLVLSHTHTQTHTHTRFRLFSVLTCWGPAHVFEQISSPFCVVPTSAKHKLRSPHVVVAVRISSVIG